MIKARNAEFIVFDVETTGLSPTEGDRIIEIAAIKVKDQKIVDVFESFINPMRELPTSAMVINKITEDMLIGAQRRIPARHHRFYRRRMCRRS